MNLVNPYILGGGSTPLANPTTAPSGSPVASGSLPANTYIASYTWTNAVGETLPSSSTGNGNAGGGFNSITWTAPALPAGATGTKWYVQPFGAGVRRYQGSSATNQFTQTAQDAGGAVEPTSNTT